MKKGVSPDGEKKGAISGDDVVPLTVIFTDLDGTLLDHISYGWEDADPALKRCKGLHIPVILASSKTSAEMEPLRHELGLTSPYISENGGGVFFPNEGPRAPDGTVFAESLWKMSLGLPYDFLVKCLGEIRDELGWEIRGFSEMTPEEISRHTGLDLEAARLAATREYDEPFVVTDQKNMDIEALYEATRRKGLNITIGGRFYHLHGKSDKGVAVDKVISWYREYHPQVLTIALGDSPNDFSMLKRVDHPVLIRSPRDFPGIQQMIPGIEVTQEMGPKGWNAAVLNILRERVEEV
jgi:mannosyl-3-phosphoglycerate phosphatase